MFPRFGFIFLALFLTAAELSGITDQDLRIKAENGDPSAMCLLARKLLDVSRKNDDRFAVGAAYWFHRAAEKGSPEGMYCIGSLAFQGIGLKKDIPKACIWFEKASAAGNMPARLKLALLDYSGVPPDPAVKYPGRPALPSYALFQIRELAGKDFVPAVLACVRILEKKGSEESLSEMVKLLEKAAQDPKAPPEVLLRLASCCDHGKGLRQDQTRALALYRRAAKAGDPEALCLLARFYEMGHIVKIDLKKSRNLYRISASLGHGAALYRMGEIAQERNDLKNAAAYYRDSMKAKYPHAACALGKMYRDGIGVECSEYEAFNCFFEGAGMGDPECQYLIGKAFYEGRGLAADHTAASFWIAQSATRGFAPAQYMIGKFYLEGDCKLPRSITKGEEWLKKAADANYGPAMRLLRNRMLLP